MTTVTLYIFIHVLSKQSHHPKRILKYYQNIDVLVKKGGITETVRRLRDDSFLVNLEPSRALSIEFYSTNRTKTTLNYIINKKVSILTCVKEFQCLVWFLWGYVSVALVSSPESEGSGEDTIWMVKNTPMIWPMWLWKHTPNKGCQRIVRVYIWVTMACRIFYRRFLMASNKDTFGFLVVKERSVEVDASHMTISDEDIHFCAASAPIADVAVSTLLVIMRSHDGSVAL